MRPETPNGDYLQVILLRNYATYKYGQWFACTLRVYPQPNIEGILFEWLELSIKANVQGGSMLQVPRYPMQRRWAVVLFHAYSSGRTRIERQFGSLRESTAWCVIWTPRNDYNDSRNLMSQHSSFTVYPLFHGVSKEDLEGGRLECCRNGCQVPHTVCMPRGSPSPP